MAARPTVGITLGTDHENYTVAREYCEAVRAAGGRPLLLPFAEIDLRGIGGVLLSGGGDIAPAAFGAEPSGELRAVNQERDEFELELARLALRRQVPLLGICRGCQVLAVAAGGKLVQDLPLGGYLNHHPGSPPDRIHHPVHVVRRTRLAAILGSSEMGVNSSHHQAVAAPPPGFAASARAPDGVIEALEADDHRFALAVQWHPERLWRRFRPQLALLKRFVEPCR
ncbi:MAG: gamma-glutamyl-gamma-aminobutyrate hydrolase family protein [Candidatus Bipolaricaulaceae bacterium]